MTFADRLIAAWYAPRLTPLTLALTPLSALFALVAGARRAAYRAGLLRAQRLPVPVVVVGNLTVGGSGKTPLVAALAAALAQRGWRPGIVSRGHGRRNENSAATVLLAAANADPAAVGDEPLLLARAGWPVAVGRDRVAAARALLAAHPRCDVILADDGLQHYRLARDVEIAVVETARGFGNGWRLPAGPLRESPGRLAGVDAIVSLGAVCGELGPTRAGVHAMTLAGDRFHRVDAPQVTSDAAPFRGDNVHAIAGIGNPQRFFATLRELGIRALEHPFPDHHRFAPADIAFANAAAILMTEKDGVKCAVFADERCWYLPVAARIDPALVTRVEEKLRGHQAA